MSDQPSADGDLQSLWQEQPSSVDASALLRRIERLLVSERRYLWVNTGLLAALLALTIWMEWIGAYRYAGLLSGGLGVGLLLQFYALWRSYRQLPAVAQLGPEGLLLHALKKARQALRNARLAYSLFPASVLLGYLSGPLLSNETFELPIPGWADAMLLVVLLAIVAATVGWGLWEARHRYREVVELERRLEEFTNGL